MKIIMARYRLKADITIYRMQNAIQNQFIPRIPIWIGGSGKKTLKIVAAYADGWNYGLCTYDEYVEKLTLLKNYCHDNNKVSVSRNYDDIIKVWHGILFIGIDETELRRIKIDSKLVIVGTPEIILREMKKYLNIGVTYFTVCFPDLPEIFTIICRTYYTSF
jgi:alkanesulfonate monooxygenase SsuD/methylene tetrahydromethanopterin reductase-like flavin-dependent oxidoreductase (luciferase family)